ncbi:MAG: response regulator [Actinobacteria bacterium]|nr:response regulator [Actinomycetota bacterium]
MDAIEILLVDDEVEFAETLAERLRLRSFNVTVAGRADEALYAMDSGLKPDVVLLDIRMPGLDGLDALGEFKVRDPEIEAILLTGHGAAASSIEGMKRGAFDYLMKPIDIGELIAKIEQAVAKKRSAASDSGSTL